MGANSGPGFKKYPKHRVATRPAGVPVQVSLNGEVIADSRAAGSPLARDRRRRSATAIERSEIRSLGRGCPAKPAPRPHLSEIPRVRAGRCSLRSHAAAPKRGILTSFGRPRAPGYRYAIT